MPEHTWGLDLKTHLADFTHYRAADLAALRDTAPYRLLEQSWAEQAGYLEDAITALPNTLAQKARAALAELTPRRLEFTACAAGASPAVASPNDRRAFKTAHFRAAVDEHGALVCLVHRASGVDYAGPAHPLGLLAYQAFSAADYARFYQQYVRRKRQVQAWAVPDFTKPGLPAEAPGGDWLPSLRDLERCDEQDGVRLQMLLSLPAEPVAAYGCPPECHLSLFFPHEAPRVEFDLQWFDKPATR